MSKIQILVIGKEPDILQTVVRLINNNGNWNAMGAQGMMKRRLNFFTNMCTIWFY